MSFDLGYMAREMKKKRIDKGWSQQDLADVSGVNKESIARYEIAATNPSFETICKIADAFNCPTDDFWVRKPA